MDVVNGLATDKWYIALTLLSGAALVGAAAIGDDPGLRKIVIMLGIGGLCIGLGQWIDHPYKEAVNMAAGYKLSGHMYRPSLIGAVLQLVGVILLGRAIWLLW